MLILSCALRQKMLLKLPAKQRGWGFMQRSQQPKNRVHPLCPIASQPSEWRAWQLEIWGGVGWPPPPSLTQQGECGTIWVIREQVFQKWCAWWERMSPTAAYYAWATPPTSPTQPCKHSAGRYAKQAAAKDNTRSLRHTCVRPHAGSR